ncbi:uncharacterized protein EMH_0009900 [Eimeria mitis]|uniref:Uncharacterized protein n=1 Tax=Eimeria mitis TaxID=44415 RepID=U6K858_9EIME|nr:uncharacterized protein EMH_0009900 [Eimeria mitis]CDJ31678.1 hypothetical protein, conserved [Eimeria mitis]
MLTHVRANPYKQISVNNVFTMAFILAEKRKMRSKKSNKTQQQQQQQKQLLELPPEQHTLLGGSCHPNPHRREFRQNLQLQQQLRLQKQSLQQPLQGKEQESQENRCERQRQLQQQHERQERRLMLLVGQLDTTGLSTPYIGECSNSSSSKGVSSRNSRASVGCNISTLGTAGSSSSRSNRNSRSSSASSSDCSSSASSGQSETLTFSSAGCSTSGPYSIESPKSLESSVFCSSSSRGGSHMAANFPRECGGAERGAACGTGPSAGTCCGAADTAAAPAASLAAPLSTANLAAAATCAPAGGVGFANHNATGDVPCLATRTAMALPDLKLLTSEPTRYQLAEAETEPANPPAEGKLETAARPVSLAGAAAAATDEWEGPDLLDIPASRKDWTRQLDLQQQRQQQEHSGKQHQPELHEQQQLTLEGQLQWEQMRATGGHCLSPSASVTQRPSAPPSMQPQTIAAENVAAPKAAALATSAAAPNAVPSRLASRLLEPSAASRPPSSINELQSNQNHQKQRRQLEDSELPVLPLLGGEFDAAPGRCGLLLPAAASVENEVDSDKLDEHRSNISPVRRGGQSSVTAAGAVVVASFVDAAALPVGHAATGRTAAAKEVNVQASEKTCQQQQDHQQRPEEQTQQQPKQHQHQLKLQQNAGHYHEEQRVHNRSTPELLTPGSSQQQKQQQAKELQLHHQQVLKDQLIGQRGVPHSLEPSVPPLPVAEIQASCISQQLSACVPHQQQQQQYQLLLQRLQAHTPHASQSETYATTRSESPRRRQLHFAVPSKQHLLQQQLLLIQEQQQHPTPLAKQRIEMQRTLFGVHLSAEAEAVAATAAGAAAEAAAAAAARPFCGGNILPPSDHFVSLHRYQEAQQQHAASKTQQPEPCRPQQVQPSCRSSVITASVETREDCCSPRGSPDAPCVDPAFPGGPTRTPSPMCNFPSPLQEGTPSGRRSPAGQQAAEASRRALLLRKNSQTSLLHICGAVNQDPQLQEPQPVQQQARWETGGTSAAPLAAAAAAATAVAAAALSQNKLECTGTSPADLSSNSTNVASDVSSANSMHSALTPHLLHPSRRIPFPLQQPGTETDPAPGGAATVTGRPPTPVRAERLRKRLERLREMGRLSRDTYPAAEVASIISGTRVEKEGPFPVYVLDKEWSLGCSALDPEWPQKMLQNTKEGIKLHSEINKLLALAKEVDLTQGKTEA